MNTKECPSCAMDVDKTAAVCPICGYEFPQKKPSLKWIALVMLVLFTYPIIRLTLRFIQTLF